MSESLQNSSFADTSFLAKCKACGQIVSSEPHYCHTHDQLLNALFWVWDGFDRALINCFFVYETAECILQNKDLEGNGVHVGVRKLEWGNKDSRAGSRPIFEAFAGEAISKQDTLWTYEYLSIPVYIHIFEEDFCIRETNQILYRNEYLKLPNPYKRFMELYGKTF